MTSPTTIAHYRITSKLGEGGMGEVYRATDTKLGRDVAIKVLPQAFAQDAVRMARFEREAQVLASLNHPNIAAIYGIEQGALVMELVEGEDLKGPLRVDTAIEYARQIAIALEAAHEKGIVHRDLKPANIKVTPEGVVKLLDFGLAKAAEETGPTGSPSPTLSPTISLAMTQAGVILGTAAYMSPEQARGKPVDRRADIWAFGVVLFEMLTGRPLFGGGETVSDSLAAVMKDEPDWNALPADTPMHVRKLLRRCLRKDPKTRLQAIGEARIALDEPEQIVTVAPVVPKTGQRWLPWAVAALALFAAGLTWWFRPAPSNPGTLRFLIPLPEGTLDSMSPAAAQAAPSPDGRHLAFIARDEKTGKSFVWVRSLSSLSAQRLDKTEDANLPFWSPDSLSIGFFAEGKLKRIPISGGSAQTICLLASEQTQGDGGTWNRDGIILFSSGQSTPLMRVQAGGGQPRPASTLDSTLGERSHIWPQFLPGGRRFLYFVRGKNEQDSGIYVQELDSPKRTLVIKNTARAAFAPPDFLLFPREGTLYAQRLNLRSWQLQGEPTAIAEELPMNTSNGRASFAVSENGVLAYRGSGGTYATQFAWYDRQGRRISTVGEIVETHGFSLSPDEKRAAVAVHAKVFNDDIWIMDMTSGVLARRTFDGGHMRGAVWSPDSQRLATATRDTIEELVLSTGKSTQLSANASIVHDWSLDGQFLIMNNRSDEQISLLPLSTGLGGDRKIQVVDMPYRAHQFRVSPDGRAIAWISRESGQDELYVASFPGFADKQRVSAGGATSAEWERDGSGVAFYGNGNLLRADIKTSPKISLGTPKALFPVYLSESGYRAFALAKDGRILIGEGQKGTQSRYITVVSNWMAEVK